MDSTLNWGLHDEVVGSCPTLRQRTVRGAASVGYLALGVSRASFLDGQEDVEARYFTGDEGRRKKCRRTCTLASWAGLLPRLPQQDARRMPSRKWCPRQGLRCHRPRPPRWRACRGFGTEMPYHKILCWLSLRRPRLMVRRTSLLGMPVVNATLMWAVAIATKPLSSGWETAPTLDLVIGFSRKVARSASSASSYQAKSWQSVKNSAAMGTFASDR